MDLLISGIISWLIGHFASKGVDITVDDLQKELKSMTLLDALDDYNQDFFNSQSNLDETQKKYIAEKKKVLADLAKNCLSDLSYDSIETTRQNFIKDACAEINNYSEDIKTYLGQIYTLVFMKLTASIPKEYIALINAYADEQRETIQEHDLRITNLEKAGHVETGPVDFSSYYERVKERFTEKGRSEYRALIGDESNEEAYIDAFITERYDSIPVLSFLENWFSDTEDRAILIYGEPGHGKSLLCDKAVFEFSKGTFMKDTAKNVLAVSLNTGENPSIIINSEVKLANALVWGAENENRFSFEDCRGSLIFLDGFDEFVDAAKQTNINNICTLMKRVKKIAYENDMHIVVLSREIAVSKSLKDLSGICSHYKLLPISERQQDKWLSRHKEYEEYKETFYKLRNNKDMAALFGVPLLFRLIVHSRFDIVSSNVVDLYDNLFVHLMRKRGIWGEARLEVENSLMDLAFKIYCTDTYMAFLEEKDWESYWIFAFYVKALSGRKVGFFHRTFYQYFLAKYIYREILKVTDEETAEKLIGSLAERELDDTVRDYLGMIYTKETESDVHAGIEKMINALVKTEAYSNFEPRIKTGDAEKSRILRSTNIYRNTFHIAAAFSYMIPFPFKENLDRVMRTFSSNGIILLSNIIKRANLSEADLRRANLRRAELPWANLSEADLNGADLRDADLTGADLIGAIIERADLSDANLRDADLSIANLKGADLTGANLLRADLRRTELLGANMICVNLTLADLSESNLSGADLTGADLRRADLSGAKLLEANLTGAKIDIDSKEIIDPATKGYDSIKWVTDDLES